MWPLKKKPKQPEAKTEEEKPPLNFEAKVKIERWTPPPKEPEVPAKEPEPKPDEEKPQQNIEIQMIVNPVTKEVTFKPKAPESPAKKPGTPLVVKWECPTCKNAFPGRVTRSRFKCLHCRNWIYFLGDNPVTKEDHERLAEKYYETRYQERLRSEGRLPGGKIYEKEVEEARRASKEALKEYADTEFVEGVEIMCCDDACPTCKRFADKKYPFKKPIPLIPIAGCTHESGCRCCYTPYVEPL